MFDFISGIKKKKIKKERNNKSPANVIVSHLPVHFFSPVHKPKQQTWCYFI